MRDGADYPMAEEYETKCMATCPIRAVCAKLEHDGSVHFFEDLPTAERGNVHYGKDPHISTRYAKGAARA